MAANDNTLRNIEFSEVVQHRSRESAWIAVHGTVYDITAFAKKHPGGDIIATSYGRDATILFETHHNMLEDNQRNNINQIMKKMEIGKIKDYKEIAKFDTPFATTMLTRVREAIKGKPHRSSLEMYGAVFAFFFIFGTLISLSFYTGSFFLTPLIGMFMAIGHLCGHAGNHWSLSENDYFNRFLSMTCTSLWGLREKYWEFSHLISHHCYNYTDRDYIMEQHVPMAYFRIRDSDPWKPIHAYQHLVYLTTPFTAFFVGAARLDCFPWIVISPLLSGMRMNKESPIPAPQFFASGSNTEVEKMKTEDDGVGPVNFVVFDSYFNNVVSLIISNIIWLPLFITNFSKYGLLHAILFNSLCFGFQAAIVTQSLLTQHMCEDIKLSSGYDINDCWYGKQVEASTSIAKTYLQYFFSYGINYQIEHHMFPCMSPTLLRLVQPIVQQTAKEFNVQYNFLPSDMAARMSVYKQFQKLAINPNGKKNN